MKYLNNFVIVVMLIILEQSLRDNLSIPYNISLPDNLSLPGCCKIISYFDCIDCNSARHQSDNSAGN